MFNKDFFYLIVLISFTELIAQSSTKQFYISNRKNYIYYILSIICYALIIYLLTLSYEHKGMGTTNIIWSGMSILIILLTGIFIYNEKPKDNDILGMILIILGITFILYKQDK